MCASKPISHRFLKNICFIQIHYLILIFSPFTVKVFFLFYLFCWNEHIVAQNSMQHKENLILTKPQVTHLLTSLASSNKYMGSSGQWNWYNVTMHFDLHPLCTPYRLSENSVFPMNTGYFIVWFSKFYPHWKLNKSHVKMLELLYL